MKSPRPGSSSGRAGGQLLPRPSSELVDRKQAAQPCVLSQRDKGQASLSPKGIGQGPEEAWGTLNLDGSGQEAWEDEVLSTDDFGPSLSRVMYQDFLFSKTPCFHSDGLSKYLLFD